MHNEPPLIGIVGATGAVGLELLSLLAERGHPAGRVLATASPKSRGERLAYGAGETLVVESADAATLARADVVILASSADVARCLAPKLLKQGCLVVDNSSAFRGDPAAALVVPEVNGHELAPSSRLVANPNCSTILLLVALEPLRRRFGLEKVVVSTYQAASGAGLPAMKELRDQTGEVLAGAAPKPGVFPEPCAFNVFPHESPIDPETGLNEEEQKIIQESRRIWNGGGAQVVPTCARVPVERSHCQSVTVTLRDRGLEGDVRSAIEGAPGVKLVDDRASGLAPTSLRAAGANEILVGRLRRAPGEPIEPLEPGGGSRTYCLWLAGDQLRKGAALNALQIADELLRLRTQATSRGPASSAASS